MSSYNMGTASGKIVIDGSGADAGFQTAKNAANAFFDTLQSQIQSLNTVATRLVQIGVASKVGFVAAITQAADFEQKMSGIQAISGATKDEMAAVSAEALKIGADTVFSAGQAADAITELVKAGISLTDVLHGAGLATVNLAAAGEISLPEAASIAAAAMNNFKLSGQDMPHIADLIAGAANASAISVSEFGISVQQAGAVAALSGLRFDDLAVAIAEMGNAGIKGSDAGTSLKTMLMNLQPTTDRQVALFNELGLQTYDLGKAQQVLAAKGIKPLTNNIDGVTKALGKYMEGLGKGAAGTAANDQAVRNFLTTNGVMQNQFYDTNGKIKSLADIQEVLAKSTSGMTEQQKILNLEMLFGADAVRAAAIMASNGAAGYNKMSAAMGNVTAQEVATTKLDNLRGSIEQLKGSVQTAAITVGTYFLPPLRRIIDAATAVINVFNRMPPGLQKLIVMSIAVGGSMMILFGILFKLLLFLPGLLFKLAAFVTIKPIFAGLFGVIRPFLPLLGGMATRAVGLVGTLGRMLTMVTGFGGVFVTVGTRLSVVSGVILRIIGFLGGLGKVIGFAFGPWGIAIQLVITALSILYNSWQPFHDLVNRTASIIKNGLVTAFQVARDWIVNTFAPAAWQGLQNFWDLIQRVAGYLGAAWGPALSAAGKSISDALGAGFNSIKSAVQNELVPAFMRIWDAIRPAFEAIVAAVQGRLIPALVGVWEKVAPALKQLWDAFQPILKVILQVAGIVIGVVLVALWELIKFIIGTLVPILITVVAKAIVGLIDAFSWIASVILGVVLPAIINFISFIVNNLVKVFQQTSDGATSAWNGVAKFFTDLWNTVTGAFNAAVAFIGQVISNVVTFVQTVWNGFWNGPFGQTLLNIIGMFIDFGNLISKLNNFIWSAVLFGIQQAWNWIVGVVTTGVNLTVAWIVSQWNGLVGIVTAIWNGIVAAAQAIWNWLVGVITTAVAVVVAGVVSQWNALVGFLTGIWNAIANVASVVWAFIASIVMNQVRGLVAFVNTVLTGFKNIINTIWDGIKIQAKAAWDLIPGPVKGAVQTIIDAVASLPQKIKDFFVGAAGWLIDAGRNIMNGLLKGINDGVDWIRQKLRDITAMIPDTKGPKERDQKLLTQNGKWIMDSLISGVDSKIPEFRRLLQSLTTNIPLYASVGASASAIGQVGAGAVSNYHSTSSSSSTVIQIDVHPAPGMNEEQLATSTARKIGYQLSNGGSSVPTVVTTQ